MTNAKPTTKGETMRAYMTTKRDRCSTYVVLTGLTGKDAALNGMVLYTSQQSQNQVDQIKESLRTLNDRRKELGLETIDDCRFF